MRITSTSGQIALLAVLSLGPAFLAVQASNVNIHCVITGRQMGNLSTCGCRGNPSGGLAKLKGFLASLAKTENDIVLGMDSGDSMNFIDRARIEKSKKLYTTLSKFGYLFMTFGAQEIRLYEQGVIGKGLGKGFPFLLSHPGDNLRDFSAPHVKKILKKDKQRLEIIFYGFSQFQNGKDAIINPNYKIKKEKTKGKSLHIAVGDLGAEDLKKMLKQNSFLDYYFGHQGRTSKSVVVEGIPIFLGGDDKNALYVHLNWDTLKKSVSVNSWMIERLGNGIPADPQILAEIKTFEDWLTDGLAKDMLKDLK